MSLDETMPPEIIELSRAIVGNPQKITIKPEQATAEKVEQAVFFVEKANKSKSKFLKRINVRIYELTEGKGIW